jgi:hypothetical protein
MIACSIALIIWCAGLSYLSHKTQKRRIIEAAEEAGSVDYIKDKGDDAK